MSNETLSLATAADDAFMGLGVDDYTNRSVTIANVESDQGSSDSCTENRAALSGVWSSPGSCIVRRQHTAATTTDGITITPDDGLELYGGFSVNFHANDCHAFAAGNGTASAGTFAVTHTLGTKPNFGIFTYSQATAGITGHGKASIGFFDDNDGTHIQISYTTTWRNAQGAPGKTNGRLFSDRVGGVTNDADGNEDESIELTANTDTTTTFTVRTNTLEGDLVGLLCYEPDYQVFVGNIDSPDSNAADWDETTAGFLPEFVMMVMGNATVVDTTMSNTEQAGNIGIFVTDFTTEVSASAADEDTTGGNSDTQSRLDADLYLADHDGTDDYFATSMTAETTGIQITAANITTADTTTHLWPTLMLGLVDSGTYWWRWRH